MSIERVAAESLLFPEVNLVSEHPERLFSLMLHLADNIRTKAAALEADGKQIGILDPDWCRANPVEAGRMHADVIVGTYGSTYALPNKDPEANQVAIESGDLDLYLMTVDGEVTGTTCLVNVGNGTAELGRSASVGRSGNTIIQDLRILDWLTSPETATKYHTLFTTLRSSPDRTIDDIDGEFLMRGGQAVTEHWRKFPGLVVNGFGPLYLKHGKLEQFSCASINRNTHDPYKDLYIASPDSIALVKAWHEQYQLPEPYISTSMDGQARTVFYAHYPPVESGLTHLVHADVVASTDPSADSLDDCLRKVNEAGSPFTQIVIPVDRDTRSLQTTLEENDYQVFGIQQATDKASASLLYGKVRPGIEVVPTHWSVNDTQNPFWQSTQLHVAAELIARSWQAWDVFSVANS